MGEVLEPRSVLSTADATPSLADFLAQSPAMGPSPPAETADAIPSADAPSPADVDLGFAESLAGSDSCGGFAGDGTLTAPLDNGEGEGGSDGSLITGSSSGNGGAAQNQPPSISALVITIEGAELSIQGTLTDESPGTCTIDFSGLVSASVSADEQGNFALRIPLPLLSGYLRAVATDEYGMQSSIWSQWIQL